VIGNMKEIHHIYM